MYVCILLYQSIGKNSIVRELSMYTGRQLHFFHCSPQVSHNTMLNLLRGMADTGMCMAYGGSGRGLGQKFSQ